VDQGQAGDGGDRVNAAFDWLFDPAHWSGPTGFPARILEHLGYTGLTVLIAALIAVPLGAVIGHTGRGTFLVAGLSNGLRALPELGLLTFLVLLTYVGLLPVVISLVILALPPILAGTYAGIRNVDRSVVDAAHGMGMRGSTVLVQVELPNALPLIIGGIRSATLQVIATATIAAYVSDGGRRDRDRRTGPRRRGPALAGSVAGGLAGTARQVHPAAGGAHLAPPDPEFGR
jgi:osmoprotectant transport system permease protein